MGEGKRPGGLTALAVINFIFSGFGFLGILAMGAMLAAFASGNEELAAEMEEVKAAFEEAGMTQGFFLVIMAIGTVQYVLLLLAGIGYLKQRKFLGRTLGNVYALVAIAAGLITAMTLPAEAGGGMNLGTLLGLLYPLITIWLINTTFRDDLVN